MSVQLKFDFFSTPWTISFIIWSNKLCRQNCICQEVFSKANFATLKLAVKWENCFQTFQEFTFSSKQLEMTCVFRFTSRYSWGCDLGLVLLTPNWITMLQFGSFNLRSMFFQARFLAKLVSQVVLACLRILREFSRTWARCLIVCQALGRVHNHRVVPISNSPPHSHHGNHPLGTRAILKLATEPAVVSVML